MCYNLWFNLFRCCEPVQQQPPYTPTNYFWWLWILRNSILYYLCRSLLVYCLRYLFQLQMRNHRRFFIYENDKQIDGGCQNIGTEGECWKGFFCQRTYVYLFLGAATCHSFAFLFVPAWIKLRTTCTILLIILGKINRGLDKDVRWISKYIIIKNIFGCRTDCQLCR